MCSWATSEAEVDCLVHDLRRLALDARCAS